MVKYFAVGSGLLSALFSVFAVFGRPQSGSLEALMASVFFGVVAAVLVRMVDDIKELEAFHRQEIQSLGAAYSQHFENSITAATKSLRSDIDATREHVSKVDKAITMMHNARNGGF